VRANQKRIIPMFTPTLPNIETYFTIKQQKNIIPLYIKRDNAPIRGTLYKISIKIGGSNV